MADNKKAPANVPGQLVSRLTHARSVTLLDGNALMVPPRGRTGKLWSFNIPANLPTGILFVPLKKTEG